MRRFSTPSWLKASIRSFMSLVSMASSLLNTVRGLGDLVYRSQAVADGNTLPVTIVLRLLVLDAPDLADHSGSGLPQYGCTTRAPGNMRAQIPRAKCFAAPGALSQHLGTRRAKLTCTHPPGALGQKHAIRDAGHIELRAPTCHPQ